MKKLVEDSKTGTNAGVVQEFLTLLAVCHTVIPETSEDTGGWFQSYRKKGFFFAKAENYHGNDRGHLSSFVSR